MGTVAVDTAIACPVSLVVVYHIEFSSQFFMALQTFLRPGDPAIDMTITATIPVGIMQYIADQGRSITAMGIMAGYAGVFLDLYR